MPTYRPTNTGFQTKGKLSRFLEPASMSIVMGSFMASMFATFITMFVLSWSFLIVIPLCLLLPNAVSLYVVFFLIQGKPKGYLRDWLRTHVFGHTTATSWKDDFPPAHF